jgi:hypothetical protein
MYFKGFLKRIPDCGKKLIWIFAIISLYACNDEESEIKDQIVVTINKTEQVVLKVHPPSTSDNFDDCIFSAYHSETNQMAHYRNCVVQIWDCGLETITVPYTATDHFLLYSRGYTASTNDYYSTDYESESSVTITYLDATKIKDTFRGRLYAMNKTIPEYVDVTGSFEIPIKE